MAANQQLSIGINIPVNRIYNFLKAVVVFNILLLIGTWLHADKVIFPSNTKLQWWLVQLNFGKENVAAAWYSSMLFFSTGIVAALCFWADMQRTDNKKGRLLNYGWLVMAGVFVMLSFDEMGSFHEMISQTKLFKKAGGGHGKLPFFILIGAVAVFMVAFFFTKFKTNKFALLLTIIGLLLFLSNPFQEKFEIQTYRSAPDPSTWHRPIIFLLLEEGSEIFASFCFLFSFIMYAVNAAPGNDAVAGKTLQLRSTAGNSLIVWIAGLALILGVIMWVIRVNAWNIPGDDNGVPQDWPPAATAFATFAAAIFLYFKKGIHGNGKLYLLIAAVSIFTSVYFGSYMYGYGDGPFVKLRYLLLTLTVIAGVWAALQLKGGAAALFFIAWVGLITLSIFTKSFSATVYGYTACACLLLGLFLHYKTAAESETSSV